MLRLIVEQHQAICKERINLSSDDLLDTLLVTVYFEQPGLQAELA